MHLVKRKLFIELLLLFIALIYYLFFVNRGIVLYDEGYYAHIADRIVQGQIPYKDFFLQFSPGYFYLLAFLYKVFGEQIIVGRLLTLFISLLILFFNLKIADKFLPKTHQKILVSLITISFGFPLINNPGILAWISVLSSLILVYLFIRWFDDQNSVRSLTLIGISLALILFIKQNLGIYFFVITNIFLLVSAKNKLRTLLIVNLSFISLTLIWFSYFFVIQGGLDQLLEFLSFSKKYLSIYSLSYPSLRFLLGPTGFLKLLPYYLPIVFLIFVLKSFKKINKSVLFLCIVSLTGFFGTVIPTSDLLHVYPFYGVVLISILVITCGEKFRRLWLFVVFLSIISGFYLTLFREYYRYQPPYYLQNTKLSLPRTKGMYIDEPMSKNLADLYNFINSNTSKNDYIFSYPFSPMLYFVLERNNPSRFSIYYPGYLTSNQEKDVIRQLETKNVKYIVTSSEYRFNTELSKYIQKKKIIKDLDFFKIFER